MNLVEETKFLTEGWETIEGHILPDNKTCLAFASILSMTQAKTIFEIGFNFGHSAYTFLSVDRRVRIHSTDIGQYRHTIVNACDIEQRFKGRFQFTQCDSHQLVPDDVSGYDMIFIDGDHTPKGMVQDMDLCADAGVEWMLVDDYVRCMGDLYPKSVIDNQLARDDFPYRKVREFYYPSTDRLNCMVLLRRYENV